MCDYRTFCNDEIDPPVPFPYPPEPPAPEAFKAMIVGDSISHGMGGDFTWRWCIFYWRKTLSSLIPIPILLMPDPSHHRLHSSSLHGGKWFYFFFVLIQTILQLS